MGAKTKRILIITGEASGDLHGAHLAQALKALEEVARPLQVQLQPVVARNEAELEDAFAAMARAHAQAVVVLSYGPYIAASS